MGSGNVVREYAQLYRQFKARYRIGIGKFLLQRMNRSLHGHGVLTDVVAKRGNKAMKSLSWTAVGLSHMPGYFKKLWQPVTSFSFAVASVKTHNKELRSHVKFYNSKSCRCSRPPRSLSTKGGTCKKWMPYDKLPWCFVNKNCKGALKAPDGLHYRNC